jgi:hypothetical protein
MKKLVLLLLAVTACAPYAPKLASPPKNQAKYEADTKFCILQGRERRDKSEMFFGEDTWKTPRDMADECMAAKGYAVVR